MTAVPTVPARRLSVLDTARVLGKVIAPTVAIGVIKRRPAMMRLVARLGLDRTAIRTMRGLRHRLGAGPLLLRLPGRSVEFPLTAEDAGRVLAATPDPFHPATTDKRAALRHFQPHGVLISTAGRAPRRAFTEKVLTPDRPLHALAPRIVSVLREDTAALHGPRLDWDTFDRQWWASVRRIVLGDAAAGDHDLTDRLDRLRQAGNWAYLGVRRHRDRFLADVAAYVRRAEPGSLAAEVAATPAEPGVDPSGQIPHWLFAFDAAGIATFRTLALLASHPHHLATARAEIADADIREPSRLPFLRACVLESVRLWPTTPALLRETVRDTGWGREGTTVFLYSPFLHRDPDTLPDADRFAPHLWLDGTAAAHPALVPFSAGPAQCPGRALVLHTTSTLLAELLSRHEITVGGSDLDPSRPLPATLDHFTLHFGLSAR